jgi:hypothetical protein
MEAGARAVFPTGTPLDAVVAQVRAIAEAEQAGAVPAGAVPAETKQAAGER